MEIKYEVREVMTDCRPLRLRGSVDREFQEKFHRLLRLKYPKSRFTIDYSREVITWEHVDPPGEPTRKSWVEVNPLICFGYPDSKTGQSVHRVVRVISADRDHILGLDTYDKNRFKKFKRSRILYWQNNRPFGVFNPDSMS